MAQNVTIISLAQMVDVSLNCKEGVINFQALHTLLHVMIQQMSLNDVAVEFRGTESDKIQNLISTIKPGSTNLYPQYSIVPAKGAGKKKAPPPPPKQIQLSDVVKEQDKLEEKKEKELRVIERRKDSKEDPDMNPLPLKSPPGSFLGIAPADLQTVVVIESQSNLPQYSVAISKQNFDQMQNQIDGLKNQVQELVELPTNLHILEAIKSEAGPVAEMFNILNLTKRMDAAEMGLTKMGSLIEDLAKQEFGDADVAEKIQAVKGSINETPGETKKKASVSLERRVTGLEKTVEEINKVVGGGSQRPSVRDENLPEHDEEEPEPEVQDTVDKGSVARESVQGSVAKPSSARSSVRGSVAPEEERASVSKARKSTRKSSQTLKIWSPQAPFESGIQNVNLVEMGQDEALNLVQTEFANLKQWVTESIQEVDRNKVFGGMSDVNTQVIEGKFEECTKQMDDMNNLYVNQIGILNEQLKNLQADMADVLNKLQVVLPGGDSTGVNAETTLDLANKLVVLEKEILSMAENAARLEKETIERDKQTETILEQIDVLKIVKANREDLEDALGEKADACMINRKVSHDQFDAACDDLTRGIEEALAKLEEQEEMWRQALDAIHREVGNKLDKMEVDPLRDFVNSKLRALQEKFKSLTALKRDQEAAGTKSKLLRNVNCISCDKDVVMRKEMDVSLLPKPYAMPPSRNMAPYLAYELDQLRKQQKCVPGSKNLNFIESALKTRGQKEKSHICNRYCGGSHTVTTPQQRVARLGHFLEQWGPEIAPLNDEYVKGNDNHMYKARDEFFYRKVSKKQSKNEEGKAGPEEPVLDDTEMPQQDRNVVINAAAEAAIIKEYDESKAVTDKKIHNIGSIALQPTETLSKSESQTSARKPSQVSQRSQSRKESATRTSVNAPPEGATRTSVSAPPEGATRASVNAPPESATRASVNAPPEGAPRTSVNARMSESANRASVNARMSESANRGSVPARMSEGANRGSVNANVPPEDATRTSVNARMSESANRGSVPARMSEGANRGSVNANVNPEDATRTSVTAKMPPEDTNRNSVNPRMSENVNRNSVNVNASPEGDNRNSVNPRMSESANRNSVNPRMSESANRNSVNAKTSPTKQG